MVHGPTGSIATLVTDAAPAIISYGSMDEAITQAGVDIAANLAAQVVNDGLYDALKDDLEMQAIASDYYTKNDSAITFGVNNSFLSATTAPILSFPVTAG